MLLIIVSRLSPCLFLWILLGIMLILVALWSRLLHLLPSLRTQRQQQQRQQQGLRLDVVPAPGLRHHLQGLPLGGQQLSVQFRFRLNTSSVPEDNSSSKDDIADTAKLLGKFCL